MCLRVTSLHIVNLYQYYVCCTRSGVIRCTLFMVLYLCRMCLCRLRAALWSDIGTLMRLFAAEPRSTAGLLFLCPYLCKLILVTIYWMVWESRVSRAKPTSFYWPSCSLPFCLLLFSLSLLSFYNNNYNNFYWNKITDTISKIIKYRFLGLTGFRVLW